MTTHLITFSDTSMSRSAELCVSSGYQHGVDRAASITPQKIVDGVGMGLSGYREVIALMENQRGVGFWSWKPFIVLEEMINGCHDGDILIYADAGIEFVDNVNYIIDRMDQDIFLFGNMYEHAHWCKRDIVEAIWPDGFRAELYANAERTPDATFFDTSWARFGKQVQASVIFFRVNDKTRAFVKEWLDWCLSKTVIVTDSIVDERREMTFEQTEDYLIDDSPSRAPNHPEFQENRHDQAILTTMAYRDGIPLHWWPAVYNDGAFIYPRGDYPDLGYPALFHHTRKRNHEFADAV